MGQRLESFGPVLPLVFGAFGEVNAEFRQMLNKLAAFGAPPLWQRMLLKSSTQATGVLVSRLRARVGMAIHRANAYLLLNRLPLVGIRASANAHAQHRARRSLFGSAGPSSAAYPHRRSWRSPLW